ncbi:hypothetical protein NQZ68_006189 [Dissostichus eleginoides]|nr:hypothetical protein NQZ68_006189 [Dissostichus eleginoides]
MLRSAFTHPRPTTFVSTACQSRSRSPPLFPTSIMRDMGGQRTLPHSPPLPPHSPPPPPVCDRAGGLPHSQGNYHTSFVAKCTGE